MAQLVWQKHELLCGVGPEGTNAFFMMNGETKEMLVIDPAGEAGKIQKTVEEMGGRPVAILLTHVHFDHMMALAEVQKAYGVPVYCGAGDEELFDFSLEALPMFAPGFKPGRIDIWVNDGQRLALAGFDIGVIAAPGHSKGSVCYYFEEDGLLVSGDVLFQGSIGRTDFPIPEAKGDLAVLMQSIRKLITTLPDGVKILPGHGPDTTIGAEKRTNPFVLHYLKDLG